MAGLNAQNETLRAQLNQMYAKLAASEVANKDIASAAGEPMKPQICLP